MLSINLKVLEETINCYEELGKQIETQSSDIHLILNELFDGWMGEQADKFANELYPIVSGWEMSPCRTDFSASFKNLISCHKEILAALTGAQEKFNSQKNRCNEFYQALTDTSYNPYAKIDGSTATGERLFADYEQIQALTSNLNALIEGGPCDSYNAPGGSQMNAWRNANDSFSKGLNHSDFTLSYYNEVMEEKLRNEHIYLLDFRDSLGFYYQGLQDTECELITMFHDQISDFAKGMDRSIYVVSNDSEVNEQRIAYLSEKSPAAYTAKEIKEMSKLVDYFSTSTDDAKKESAYQLLRNYCVALNTTENLGKQYQADFAKLSNYFGTVTKLQLTDSNGEWDYTALNKLMETNPYGITQGDLDVITEMFDSEFCDVERSSVDAGNAFLASCYIKDQRTGIANFEASRSPVFDKWYKGYAKSLETTPEDMGILRGSINGSKKEVDAKFLKQVLLSVVADEKGKKMSVIPVIPVKDGIPKEGLFIISDTLGGSQATGDYKFNFTMSGEFQEIEYFGFRDGVAIREAMGEAVERKLESYKKDLWKLGKEKGWKYGLEKTKEILCDKLAKEAGKELSDALTFGILNDCYDMFEQNKKNKEIDIVLGRSLDGKRLEAHQIGGQVVYINGEISVNHLVEDKYMEQKLLQEFESNLPNSDVDVSDMSLDKIKIAIEMDDENDIEGNSSFSDFTMNYSEKNPEKETKEQIEEKERILKALITKDRKSPEYEQCFLDWYYDSYGDAQDISGTFYKNKINEERIEKLLTK